MKRTDKHCPSNLIPADYSHVMVFAFGGNGEPPINLDLVRKLSENGGQFFSKPSGKGGCDVCGAHYRYGSVFKHEPTGEYIRVGWECADKIDASAQDGRQEVLAKLDAARRKYARKHALRSFVATARGSKAAGETILADLRCDHRIVQDIRAKLIQWGSLTDAQAGLVRKLAREARERAIRPAEVKVPAPEGKQTVRGEVVSVKEHASDFGYTMKMTVKVEAAGGVFLVWVTVPKGLVVERGNHVEFTATLTRSDRDPGFAFGKRPTAASKLEVARS